jgi:PilZ domain
MDGEKRQGPRSFAIAEVSFDHKGMHFHGRINDLSSGGMYIDTINPLPEGSSISFQFSLPGDDSGSPISGEGRIVWMVHMQGMGINFTRLSDDDRDRLRAYLSRR